jgi:hypothetical protein
MSNRALVRSIDCLDRKFINNVKAKKIDIKFTISLYVTKMFRSKDVLRPPLEGGKDILRHKLFGDIKRNGEFAGYIFFCS